MFTHLDFKVWINGEMFRLIRERFQGERIKNADVFALFPPAIRFFSDVAEIVRPQPGSVGAGRALF